MAYRNFNPNDAGFKEMAVGDEIRAALKDVGEKAKTIAVGLSADFRITGDYMDSFEVVEATEVDFAGQGPRAVAQLLNTSEHAAAVEWGYQGRSQAETSSAHRVLGRTLDALAGE